MPNKIMNIEGCFPLTIQMSVEQQYGTSEFRFDSAFQNDLRDEINAVLREKGLVEEFISNLKMEIDGDSVVVLDKQTNDKNVPPSTNFVVQVNVSPFFDFKKEVHSETGLVRLMESLVENELDKNYRDNFNGEKMEAVLYDFEVVEKKMEHGVDLKM